MTTNGLRAMYERATTDCGSFVALCAGTDLRAGTPCEKWDLGDLLAHIIGQNEGFAAAVRAGDADVTAYEARPVTSAGAHAEWAGSAARVVDAFRSAPAEQRVRIAGFGTFGVEAALRMQLLDTVVHAWDVAAALELRYRPDEELVEFSHTFAAHIAKGYPNGQPGVFAAPLSAHGVDPWADALRLLGRPAPL